MSENLSRVEITQRNRKRHKILRAALAENGISERRLYVDDRLYRDLKAMAAQIGNDFHTMLFVAMREFLANHSDKDYSDCLFLFDNAMLTAQVRMEAEGVGELRAMASAKGAQGGES